MDLVNLPINENLVTNNPPETQVTDAAVQEKETVAVEENGSANNSTENMESLLVEEDEEDGLGTESLLLSLSEGEKGEHISPVRQKKRSQKIIDSDDDETTHTHNENEEGELESKSAEPEINESKHVAYKPKRFAALLDSDSESEAPEKNIPADDPNNDRKQPAKFSALIDSDSEPEPTMEDLPIQTESSKNEQKTKKKKNKTLKKSKENKSINSESEGESSTQKVKKKKSKVSDLIDSDSSDSSNASDVSNKDAQVDEEGNATTKKPKKPQRASAKKAMDEMQAIQSETQRLHREAQVSIPYHKPKRHTLKEFLTRKNIAKPKLALEGSGKKLKMSPEELEEYAKHLEERAKEATEFFKSESDDEMKDTVEENETNDKEEAAESHPIEQTEQETTEASKILNTDEIDRLLQDDDMPSLPTTQELLNIELPPPTASTPDDTPKDPPEPLPSTSNSKQSSITKSLTELKLRLIAENNIPAPTLKGDPNMMIDFETGDMFAPKPTGLDSLFQRFMKCNKNNKKKPVEPLSQDVASVLKVGIIEESNKEKEPKPGAAYMKLKENLRTLITKKRKEEFQKKIEENQEEEDEYNKCCGLDDDDEEDEENQESEKRHAKKDYDIVIDEEENEIEYEDEDEKEEDQTDNPEVENKNDDENKNCNNDEEDEEEENQNEEDEDDEDNSDESEEEPELNDPSTKKHRVIKAFEDSDDDLTTGLNTTSTSGLFTEEKDKNPEEVENELLGLCSGQFGESQKPPLISQIPVTQIQENACETELMDLCSGAFVEEPVENQENQFTVMKIVSSDEEKDPDEETCQTEVKKIKKLTKKKKRAQLCFSDDEDDVDYEKKDSEKEEENQDLEENEDEEEIPQTYIDYDSEENEIEVQMSKKDCFKQANAFVEKEAELSESEWGSADEDEQNLDKYDVELGDEDEFDQNKIQTELGQIHMRKILDQDIREVKKLQDMFFDNEENDGVGRERQFRWKNIESGFSLDDPAGGGADNDEKVDSADDEEEMQWRKMRFEREQLLKQKTKEEILEEVSKTTLGRNLLQSMKADLKPEIKFTKEILVEKEYKAPSFLIALRDTKSMRGSFLNYDKETLARIADSITKSGDYTRDEQTQAKASKTGNFVFAQLSEEEQAMRKRKAEERNNANAPKKIKTSSKKSLLLDKLL